MALTRISELLKRGEQATDPLDRRTDAARRPARPAIDRGPHAWTRFLVATLAAHRPAGT